ncbi:serine hydrolase [Nonomuraea ferruginea]
MAELTGNSPETTEYTDTGMTPAQLCRAGITKSDGFAGNTLLKQIGGPPGLTRFFRATGDRTSRLDRTEPTLTHWAPGEKRDTTTPAAAARTFAELTTGKTLHAQDRARLVGWLKASLTGANRIKAGLPKDWTVGDKTGTGGASNHGTARRPRDRLDPRIERADHPVGLHQSQRRRHSARRQGDRLRRDRPGQGPRQAVTGHRAAATPPLSGGARSVRQPFGETYAGQPVTRSRGQAGRARLAHAAPRRHLDDGLLIGPLSTPRSCGAAAGTCGSSPGRRVSPDGTGSRNDRGSSHRGATAAGRSPAQQDVRASARAFVDGWADGVKGCSGQGVGAGQGVR